MDEEDSDHSDTVTLLIEDVPLKCSRQQLVSNSNYFKAMFEGSFLERDQSVVTLEAIDLKSMRTILAFFGAPSQLQPLAVDDLLRVLQTASMLQLDGVRERCLHILTERLDTQNCLKIWFACEPHDARPLCQKAKHLALSEFDAIRATNALADLDHVQLHAYLANALLCRRRERDVFAACARWWRGDGRPSSFVALLACVDFGGADEAECRAMLASADARDDEQLRALLRLVVRLKQADLSLESASSRRLVDVARTLLRSRRRRESFDQPMLFVKKRLSPTNDVEVCYDAYKRKRKYQRLGAVEESVAALFIYDMLRKKYVKCVDVPEEKYMGCEGFHIVGHKTLIFFFGGEVTLGSGRWNLDVWAYDTIRERWERKTRLPSGRRHFQSCICGPYLYIVGGTGAYRIVQDNMLWYNYVDNVWSAQLPLPCAAGELRCCAYDDDRLLLLNMRARRGYLLDARRPPHAFAMLDFDDDDDVARAACYPTRYALFARAGRAYAKAATTTTTLVEFEARAGRLRVRAATPTCDDDDDDDALADGVESVVCGDDVVTLYKCAQSQAVRLEVTPMPGTGARATRTLPAAVGDDYVLDLSTKLFALRHHRATPVGADVYVNELADVQLDCDDCDQLG